MTPYAKKKAEVQRGKKFYIVSVFVLMACWFFSFYSPPIQDKYYWLGPAFLFVLITLNALFALLFYYLPGNEATKIKCTQCAEDTVTHSYGINWYEFHNICPKCGNDNRVQ